MFVELLDGLGERLGCAKDSEKARAAARLRASQMLLRWFRQGSLGRYTLDDIHDHNPAGAALLGDIGDDEGEEDGAGWDVVYPKAAL